MATRLKTIQFATPTNTTLVSDATVTNLSQITLYIPEASPTFISVSADVHFQDVITVTGGTIGEHRVGLRLGAAAYTTFTETDDITHDYENMACCIAPIDFTSHFTTNWTGTSMTCDIQVYFDQTTGTTLGMNNVNAILTITYQYDDSTVTNTTQIKTVMIPLESLTTTLTTTANSNIGTNQIPILTGASGILKENSPVIRDYYFIVEGNDNQITATTFQISANIDSGGSPFTFASGGTLTSSIYTRLIYKPTVPDTTTTHNFQLWSSTATKFHHCSITLIVTYEFNAASSTSILNSIIIPIEILNPLGFTTSSVNSRGTYELFIPETNISIVQSAFRINYNMAQQVSGINFRMGAQTYRTYTDASSSAICGMHTLQQRCDSGGSQGAGLTLTRGNNTITIDGYTTDNGDFFTNITGFIILNYTSDIPTNGIGEANHTIFKYHSVWDAYIKYNNIVSIALYTIPENNYYINAVGFIINFNEGVLNAGAIFNIQCLTTEGKGGGYYNIYSSGWEDGGNVGITTSYISAISVIKNCPYDIRIGKLDIETSRRYMFYTTSSMVYGISSFLTYHSFTYTTTLNITNSSGGTVNVKVFRADNDELIRTTSRTGNGTVSVVGFDNTMDVYAIAYESDTKLGRSANFNFGD